LTNFSSHLKGVRRLVPFPVRVAFVRWRDRRRFDAEHSQFAYQHASDTAFPFLVAEHRSPLRRPGTTYDEDLQRGKEINVALASQHIDQLVLEPGQVFSYHHAVGAPTRKRGFVMGAELHDDNLSRGVGGGACQVSNLLYVLALLSGATIVERHRHGFDLFPDSGRTVPFGCGATVFFCAKDLRFRNDLGQALMLRVFVDEGFLVGQTFSREPVKAAFELFELEGSISQDGDRWIRRNIVARRERGSNQHEVVAENEAICLYDPGDHR
jgi:vancomycin resistance protein VanW